MLSPQALLSHPYYCEKHSGRFLLIFLHLFFYIPSFLDLAAIDLDANRLAAAGILAIELGGVVGLTYLHNKFVRS